MKPDPNLEQINELVNDRILARGGNASIQIGDDGEDSTPATCEIGRAYLVRKVSFTNIQGGTEIVVLDAAVQVIARFWDYETGWNHAGRITEIRGNATSVFTGRNIPVPVCVRFSQHDLR
jgi:hypothetical protein